MRLLFLEELIAPVREKQYDLSFPFLIRECRDSIGLKQYRIAEMLGMGNCRLKNLEIGYFRAMPTNEELNGLSKLYNLDCENLRKKAQEFVDEHDKRKRGRRFSSMSGVQS